MNMKYIPLLLTGIGILAMQGCATRKRAKEALEHATTYELDAETYSRGNHDAYIRQYAPLAMREMQRTGIPASIKLAQAILESRAGTSELAQNAKNHFGVKCSSSWRGPSYSKIDDERGPDGRPIKSCFRMYDDPIGSYMDHSAFLQQSRYRSLYALPQDDYVSWARGLQQAGYATDPKYADKLIDLIRRNDLHQYDKPETKKQAKTRIVFEGQRRSVVALHGETLSDIARLNNKDAVDLAGINKWRYAPLERLRGGEIIYLDPDAAGKTPAKASGNTARRESDPPVSAGYHTVARGDTLFSLSRQYQTTVEQLKKLNNLSGSHIQVGQRLRIR